VILFIAFRRRRLSPLRARGNIYIYCRCLSQKEPKAVKACTYARAHSREGRKHTRVRVSGPHADSIPSLSLSLSLSSSFSLFLSHDCAASFEMVHCGGERRRESNGIKRAVTSKEIEGLKGPGKPSLRKRRSKRGHRRRGRKRPRCGNPRRAFPYKRCRFSRSSAFG